MAFVSDFEVGVRLAQRSQKLLLLYLTGLNDIQCRDIEHRFVLPRLDELERDYVVIRMFVDVLPNFDTSKQAQVKIQNAERLLRERFQEVHVPMFVVLTTDGQTELRRFGIVEYYSRPEALGEFLSNRPR